MIIKLIKKIIRVIFKLKTYFILPPATDIEKKWRQELREGLLSLSILNSKTEKAWSDYINRLRFHIEVDDPRTFLQWNVVLDTMFIDWASYISYELDELKNSASWKNKWESALLEDSVGYPIPYIGYPKSSGTLIHHAYHLHTFESITNIKPESMIVVVEFGGGYGSLCRLFSRLGHLGIYIIFDLPEFSMMQRYYLVQLGINIISKDKIRMGDKGVVLVTSVVDLFEVMKTVGDPNLFIATWSLSEAPVSIRQEMFEIIKRSDSILLAYQHEFQGIDNKKYFTDALTSKDWEKYLNKSIDHIGAHSYLIASKESSSLNAR